MATIGQNGRSRHTENIVDAGPGKATVGQFKTFSRIKNGDPKAAADISIIRVVAKVQTGSPELYFHQR